MKYPVDSRSILGVGFRNTLPEAMNALGMGIIAGTAVVSSSTPLRIF